MKGNHKRGTLMVAALLAAAAAAGCAQDIGDIDRTEPNRVRKSDLTSGAWWMHQKIVSVPGYSSLEAFEGLMTDTTKVVFVAEENYLMAYRSYPILPGADNQLMNYGGATDTYEELYGDNYKGDVVAMYPISSHFDVQREYDASTGEQSNVIVENTSDRPWYERDYIRVEWDKNPLLNFEHYIWADFDWEAASFSGETPSDPNRAPYFEYDADGQLVYFDAPTNAIIQTTIMDWVYMYFNESWAPGMSGIEVRVATSFGKDLGDADSVNNYEPLDYPNADMNRFGYFRTERHTYDNINGMMNAGRIELANRHNIWQAAYNADGSAIPVEMRTVRTIPYYIKGQLNEPLLAAMSEQVIDEWNIAFKRAVYIMQHPDNTVVGGVDLISTIDYDALKTVLGSAWSKNAGSATYPAGHALQGQAYADVFVPCHIPVRKGDNAVCGEEGYSPREGDFRKNFLWLVNQRQDVGLLGYCPTVTDPLTGRSISAQSHVYTAPMNEIAHSIVEQIKFAKGELTIDGVRDNDVAVAHARKAKDIYMNASALSDKVRSAQLNSKKTATERAQKRAERTLAVKNLRKFDFAANDAKLKKLIDSGLISTDIDSKALNALAYRSGVSASQLPESAVNATSLFSQLSFKNRHKIDEIKKTLGAKGYDIYEKNADAAFDIVLTSLVNKYKDRNDYDNIFNEVRAQVFRATALHEMGHGFGLRHNHTGSYDSMNYFNQYWNLRGIDDHSKDPNFWKERIESVGDMYALYDYSEAQLKGDMLGNQYSSLMDYSSGYLTDNKGLGKYDHAAILYAYSAGTSNKGDASNPGVKSKGLVEIFTGADKVTPATREDLGWFAYDVLKHKDTTKITSTFDDQTAVGQPYLELVHFRDFFSSMKGYNFITNRKVVRLDDYLAHSTKENLEAKNAWVRVPYLFCTDDNRGALRSCNVWDHGADYMEQVKDTLRLYYDYYWFRSFSRGRAFWTSWGAAQGDARLLFPLSDWLKNDYVADWETLRDISDAAGLTLSDSVNDAASIGSVNFIANVIATPEYGLYCKRRDNGRLFNLSTDDDATGETNEFYEISRCGRDAEYYYVRQGEGRKRYQKFDVNAGFDYSKYALEKEHNDTSFFAILALLDNSANVIVDSGDMGTYTLGMYTRYREEVIKLANAVLNEDYGVHSPVLVYDTADGKKETTTYKGEEVYTGHLVYPPLITARYFNADGSIVEYDPLTGKSIMEFNKLAAFVPHLAKCDSEVDCLVGDADVVYCDTLYNEQVNNRCFQVYEGRPAKCPSGLSAASIGGGQFTCLPEIGGGDVDEVLDSSAASAKCSIGNPGGSCEDGLACRNGACVEPLHRVETDSSLAQKFYFGAFATLLTSIERDPTFYDQFNIYRVGSGRTNTPAEGFETVTFENPFTGEIFAANDRVKYNRASDVQRPGGATMIKRANALAAKLDVLWKDVIKYNNKIEVEDESDPNYVLFLDYYYQWYRVKYDLEGVVADINQMADITAYFGTLF